MSKLLLTSATAIALVTAPTIAAAQITAVPVAEVEPASETVTGSAMDGDMTYVWIGQGVVALALLFILLDDDDDDDDDGLPISP